MARKPRQADKEVDAMVGRFPWTLFFVIGVVVALAITASSGQESAPKSSHSPAPKTTTGQPLDLEQKDAMDEILRIRQRHGDLLAGSIFAELPEESPDSAASDPDSDRFAQALKRVMERRPAGFAEPAADKAMTQHCEAAYARVTGETAAVSVAEDSPFSRSLRRSARLLDRRANDLEDQLMYEQADRLRDLATQLRHEARTSPRERTARRR